MGDVALDSLLATRKRVNAPTRRNVPVVHPYARGSMQRLGLGGPTHSLTIDVEQADKDFLEDRWARTSRAPRESRWATYRAFCSSRGHQPLPVTVKQISDVGSLFKAARYRSPGQYFSVAKGKHVEAGYTWSQTLDLARSQAIRSIVRGMGPAAPKLDLHLESAPVNFDDALKLTAVRLVLPEDVRLPFPGPTAIGASWFLLRGIEVSNVRCQDVTFSRDPRQVTLQLPVSKADPEAKGCARTHCCICYKSREPLCVYHALLDIVMALQKGQAFRPEAYLFGTEGRMPTARQVTALAKCCAITLGQESLDDWHAGALDRWAQHSFRVAGAQFLARCGIDVAVIQLIGRWGSNAILRYVQTAAFVPERAAQTGAQALGHPGSVTGSASSSPQHPPDAESQNLRELVCRIVNECILSKPVMVHNPRTKIA